MFNKHVPYLVLFIGCSVLFHSWALAEEADPARIYHLRIDVTGAPEVAGSLNDCMKSELEKFDDVAVGNGQPDWIISIVGLQLPARGGYSQDYAFSVMVLRPAEDIGYIKAEHQLYVGMPNVKSACKAISVDFAKNYLSKKTEGVISRY